jgi:hypothetical protein
MHTATSAAVSPFANSTHAQKPIRCPPSASGSGPVGWSDTPAHDITLLSLPNYSLSLSVPFLLSCRHSSMQNVSSLVHIETCFPICPPLHRFVLAAPCPPPSPPPHIPSSPRSPLLLSPPVAPSLSTCSIAEAFSTLLLDRIV